MYDGCEPIQNLIIACLLYPFSPLLLTDEKGGDGGAGGDGGDDGDDGDGGDGGCGGDGGDDGDGGDGGDGGGGSGGVGNGDPSGLPHGADDDGTPPSTSTVYIPICVCTICMNVYCIYGSYTIPIYKSCIHV